MSVERPVLRVGDWLDVIDGDSIWNVAQVLKVPTAETVEITYDCWGDQYNEELRQDSDRIAPFHTHTWTVKCWVKLAPWPWWPALLTLRAPGSERGVQNLRIEESLLVDFLDKAEFTKRFRCWVNKSNIVAFQSDRGTRLRLTKHKMKGIKADARSKNLTFAKTLLAKSDAQEDFPEFVEGTLPRQFKHSFTRSMEEVRNAIGEDMWMRGFVDNRVNHAATHVYTPVVAGESDSGNGTEFSTPVEKTDASAIFSTCDVSSLPNADTASKVSTPKKATDASTGLVENKRMIQTSKIATKRARLNVEDDNSDSTESSRAGKDASIRKGAQKNQYQGLDFDGECRNENSDEKVSKLSAGTIEPRRYGKTPKKLKTARRSTSKLPPYIPPYGGLLPRAEPDTASPSHTNHAALPRPLVKKGGVMVASIFSRNGRDLRKGESDKVLPASDQDVLPPKTAMKRVSSCELKSGAESVSPVKSCPRTTIPTLRPNERMRTMETAVKGELTELTEKAAEAEEIRNKYAALPIRVRSRTSVSPQKHNGDSQVRSLAPDSTSETQGVTQEDLLLGTSSDSLNASVVPTLARRSSQPKFATQKLELALDNAIAKLRGQKLSAATTPAGLDAIKAELLLSPEVQAAIIQLEHPSHRWAAPDFSYPGSSSLSISNFGCASKEARKPGMGQSARWPSHRSSSPLFGRSWEHDHDSETGDSEGSQSLLTRSVVLNPPPRDHSSFGFSVNDNFSVSQWYRDLYPKSFGFQQPW